MMFANNYNNNLYQGGMQPQNNRQPKFTNPLTNEDIQNLRQQAPAFTLKTTKDEMDRAICTHRYNGQKTLRNNPDGSVTCSICGATYKPFDGTEEEVEKISELYVSILQTIKTLYLDIPDDVCKAFFQMIPFINKTAKLFKIASNNFESYNPNGAVAMNQNGNPFAIFNNIMGGGYNQAYSYPQQQMNPQMMGYNGFNPQMQPAGVNPFQSPQQFQADQMVNNNVPPVQNQPQNTAPQPNNGEPQQVQVQKEFNL